jgi:uncharacterized protein (TIGR04141 family)
MGPELEKRGQRYFGHLIRPPIYALLDKKLIRIAGVQGSEFEAADLLDIQGKRLIHIKKSSRRSSVLSHFFKQGSNSAQRLKRFPDALTNLEQALRRDYGNDVATEFREAMAAEEEWTVEFVIADSRGADGRCDIPFFSKGSL